MMKSMYESEAEKIVSTGGGKEGAPGEERGERVCGSNDHFNTRKMARFGFFDFNKNNDLHVYMVQSFVFYLG